MCSRAARRLERELAGGADPAVASVGVSYEGRAGWGRMIVAADLPAGGDPAAAERAIVEALDRLARGEP